MHSSLSLSDSQQQFQAWRLQKSHSKERIPEHLWQLAVQFCDTHPLTRVAKHLNLDVGSLRQHRQRLTAKPTVPSSLRFVELDVSPAPSNSSRCQRVELERVDGVRMRLYCEATHDFDVTSLIHSFLQG